MLIDTHAHLWWTTYANPPSPKASEGHEATAGKDCLKSIIERAKQAGVEKIIVPGTDEATSKQAVELAKKYSGILYAAIGIHPEEILGEENSNNNIPISKQIQTIKALINENRNVVVAVGEIGTDAYTSELKEIMGEQKELFKEQIKLGLEYDLPVIVHTRESLQETLETIDAIGKIPRGVFHCFSYDETGLQQILERGFYISFCANITWSKRLQRIVAQVPSDRLLLETDSPFMTPISKKPEQNEPANVRITAELIAQIRGVTLEELAATTTNNARELFKI